MKTPKSYRLSPRTIKAIDQLHTILPGWNETDIIEAAIECLLASETTAIQIKNAQNKQKEEEQ